MRPETKLILIGGASCSGKTRLALNLVKALGGDQDCNLLHMDGWYKPDLPNFDVPSAVFQEEFETDILNLHGGLAVEARYLGDHTNQVPVSRTLLEQKKFLVAEGVFVLGFERISSVAALKIYLEASAENICLRRIRRDVFEYGEDLSSVLSTLENQVLPGTRKYVAPTKRSADVVLPESESVDQHLKKVLGML